LLSGSLILRRSDFRLHSEQPLPLDRLRRIVRLLQYSGRWIPFIVALSAVQTEFAELVRCVDRDILRPISQLNFGVVPQYEIRPKPLTETYGERFGKATAPPE